MNVVCLMPVFLSVHQKSSGNLSVMAELPDEKNEGKG